MDAIELHTERLILKGITPALIHELFNTKSDEEIKEILGVDERDLQRYIEMHEMGMESHRFSLYYFLLVDKASGRTIGESGFHTLNKRHGRAELFYVLHDDTHKRKGLMTEAVPLILQFGFETLGLHRIEALVAKWNTPSIRLLQNNGFTFEGTMREDYVHDGKRDSSDCWSLLRWEWEERKSTINR